MKVKIVELFVDGRRLPRQDSLTKTPVEGELLVDYAEDICALSVPTGKVATLRVQYGPRGFETNALEPLLEPQLIRMTKTGFVLRGVQMVMRRGESCQLVQEWWAKPISK